MAKKIFSISIIKNEADIIESFIRYNINILDGMILLDNNSSDNTVEILNSLKKERLNLHIIKDEDKEFDQTHKMNKLMACVVNKFKVDIIVPLDADEFIITPHKKNPREFVENIEFPNFGLIKIKTYYPSFDKENEKFIPSRITFARDGTSGEYNKVIVPKELVKKFDVKLTKGNHYLTYNSEYEDIIKEKIVPELRIAHFPIRSKEQFISKVSVGWINNLNDINRSKYDSWHLKEMFNELKNSGKIENSDVTKFAKKYSTDDQEKEVNIKYDPINLSFCKDILIRYDHQDLNPMGNFLENAELLSNNYLNLKKEYLNEKKRYESEIKKFKRDNDNLSLNIDELKNERLQFENKIREYKNSTSWIVTTPLRKLNSFLKALKNK